MVFTEIILPIIEAKTIATFQQRVLTVRGLERILSTPVQGGKILVELYMNYDCDINCSADENIWERLVSSLSFVMTSNLDTSDKVHSSIQEPETSKVVPSITTAGSVTYTSQQVRDLYSQNGDLNLLKKHILKLLVNGILQSLVLWCQDRSQRPNVDNGVVLPDEEIDDYHEDPSQFHNQKLHKQHLIEGIKRFNIKFKKGIKFLLDTACIQSPLPKHIAAFLLHTEGLDKHVIGEYLGEGDLESIAIMHAFVDLMDFASLSFVDALRSFLQHFRLPGESQKIDRFMLKFAERYVNGNPASFSSADTAYVLAYSVIMLNTDQHNPQVKKRMSKQDFIKNNRGIDEGKDVPMPFLEAIYDEIGSNEIKLKGEHEDITTQSLKGTDPAPMRKKSGAMLPSENLNSMDIGAVIRKNHGATKNPNGYDARFSEPGFESKSIFFSATHSDHVKPMFQLIWVSSLMSISSFLQRSEELDTIIIALEGFKSATHIACIFDLELERKGFLSNMFKFTHLESLSEIKMKNVETVKMLLEMTFQDGNDFEADWVTVIKCISQLEKIQQAPFPELDPRALAHEIVKFKSMEKVYDFISSQSITLSVDRLFAQSHKLSASAIIHFVTALCELSWDEIVSSADPNSPRMYCLQRLVEIGYYNMGRIRLEWTHLWLIMGPHLNQVACHQNTNIGYFALDKLRQLSMKFLDLEELQNFKFQLNFLQPFQSALQNGHLQIKDMALTCLLQMVQTKGLKLKSGWKAIFTSIKISAADQIGTQDFYFRIDCRACLLDNEAYRSNIPAICGS